MKQDLERQIDQFATRDLAPAKARTLAQRALEDADLFDALVARGAVEASLEDPDFRRAVSTPVRPRRWVAVLGAGAAAAAAVLAVFFWRGSPHPNRPAQQAGATISTPRITPALDNANQSGQPVLLASELSRPGAQSTPIFRGGGPPDREPQANGKIIAQEDGQVTVNLGTLDGLAKGTDLEIFRGATVGRMVITTVFRDRARGRIVGGAIQVNDEVRVPAVLHLAAIYEKVGALAATGDLTRARDLARKALSVGSSGESRALLERLAALDYQAGAIDAAREHYEAAANNFQAPPAASASEQAATLNSLGTLYLIRGDLPGAEKPLNQAASQTAIDPDLRAQILNNLGVLAEMRGDLATARDAYSRASAEKAFSRERNVAQANLARLKRP